MGDLQSQNKVTSYKDNEGNWTAFTGDFWVQHSLKTIESKYSDIARVKPGCLLKHGFSANADASQHVTVMSLPGATQYDETYVSTNVIDTVSSSNVGDTVSIIVEGHTISGGVFTAVTQTVTLTGQTKAVLGTALARVSRIYNDDSTDILGTIYCYEDDTVTLGVPDTDAKVHLMIELAHNQSGKAATTIADGEYGILTAIHGGMTKTAGAAAAVDISIETREAGKVFRHRMKLPISKDGGNNIMMELKPHLILRPNSDVRIIAESNTNDTAVFGGFNMIYAEVQT